jgi:hypothetical protein
MTDAAPADDGDGSLYDALQVSPTAGQDVIAAAFRVLARRHHPDTNQAPDAARRMQLLNDAYAVLSDPDRRARYDAERARARPRLRHSRADRAPPGGARVIRKARTADIAPGSFVVRLLIIVVLVMTFVAAGLVLWSGEDPPTPRFPRQIPPRSDGAVRLVASSEMTASPGWSQGSMNSQCALNCA